MRVEGVLPNSATYNAVISGCYTSGDWRRALRLLERMTQDPRPEAQPEVLSFSLVLKACGRGRRWETALELLADMQVEFLLGIRVE